MNAASLGYSGSDVRWSGADALCDVHELLGAAGIQIASVYRRWELLRPLGREEAREFFACLRLLAESGYRGYLSAEHFGVARMKDGIRESAEYIDGILSSII